MQCRSTPMMFAIVRLLQRGDANLCLSLEKIEELKCNDPFVIDLHLFKSESDLKKLIPPITRDHLIVYLIVERRGSDGEKVEAVNNVLASEQYLTFQFFYFCYNNTYILLYKINMDKVLSLESWDIHDFRSRKIFKFFGSFIVYYFRRQKSSQKT